MSDIMENIKKMKCPVCNKEFDRAVINIWGRRFCPYCNFDLGVDIK